MSAFLVACLLLIPSNLSRIKSPLRKNGPGPNTCYANGSKSPGPPRADAGPGASSPGCRAPSSEPKGTPELGDTPKAPKDPQSWGAPPKPPIVQAQFHPHIMVLNSFRLSLPFLSRITDMEGIKENLRV